jgi:spermidine synthase
VAEVPGQPPRRGAADGPVGLVPADRGARRRRSVLFLAVCCLGVSAIVTQLVLMRELLCVLAGNEMILGIILGNWFLLTGLGSALGRTAGRLKRPIVVLVVAQVLVAVLPVADCFAVRALRNVVFVRGAEVGVVQSLVSCFVLLLPYCLIAGYLLALACRLLADRQDAAGIGRVYFLDVLGDIAGGLLFTFVLVHWLDDHFAILYVPAALNFVFAVAVAAAARRKLLAAGVGLVAAAFVVFVGATDLDALATSRQYEGQEVVDVGSSPYGRLVVTKSARQLNFIENGVPLFSTHEHERVEETVHYAMAQRPGARRVLLVGGGVSGTAREVLKYPVERVDYVELDPQIIEAGRRHVRENLADERIGVHATDGRLYVRRTRRRYDVVIVDVPDPGTSQLNRFYTSEFVGQVRRILSPGGVVSISLGGYANYLSEELARVIGSAHRTLAERFAHVLMLPGGRVFFLASDGELTSDIAARIEQAGIETQYVTREFLVGTLTPDRMADLRRAVSRDAPVNRDFSPVLYYYHLLHWAGKYRVRFGVLGAIAAAALAIYLVRLRPVTFAILTTGFAASALEVVVLVGFQIVHGCVYHRVGLIVTMFMAGLAAGSYLANRTLARRRRGDLVKMELGVAAYAVLLPGALFALDRLAGAGWELTSAWVAFPLLTFGLAVLVGMEFPLACKADFRAVTPTASRLYTADYVGGAVGALLVSTLLIPLVGVLAVCAIAAGLNVLSALVLRLTSAR